MNKVALVGRLTRDPDIRYVQDGMQIAKFSVAVGRRYKRPNEPDADFINCVSFGKTAEFIGKYFGKGNAIGISGRIQTSSWDDATTGQKRYNTEVVVEEVEFVESKASSDNTSNNNYNNQNNNYNNQNNNQNNQNNQNNYNNNSDSPDSYYNNPNDNYNNNNNNNSSNSNNPDNFYGNDQNNIQSQNNSQNNEEFYNIETGVDEEDLPF